MSRTATRKRFQRARRRLDEISGTMAVTRDTENSCFHNPDPVTYNKTGWCDKPKNPDKEDYYKVLECASILDEKGKYAGFSDPRRILLSLHEDGLVWFEMKHVKQAITRKKSSE